MSKTTIIIIVVVVAVGLLFILGGRALAKRAEEVQKKGLNPKDKPPLKQPKTEALIIEGLLDQGYNQEEAEQIATSQLLASGHSF